jgi:pimeloyl-ACP methyl ester carboxylesterase
VAPDWRGYGHTAWSGSDSYEVGEYIGDLDTFCRHLSPHEPVRILAHSLGGNVAMMYAGVRPERVAALVNMEGLGLPAIEPAAAPARLIQWLDQIAGGARLADYESAEAYARRLCAANPRLDAARASFLAAHSGVAEGGRWRLLADPAHKVVNRGIYRLEEVLACWRGITAPVLWVEGDDSESRRRMLALPGYEDRLGCVATLQRMVLPDAGHMMHHEQPDALAQRTARFLAAVAPTM